MMVNYPNWKSLVEPTATGIFMGIYWLIMVNNGGYGLPLWEF